jgi:putative surface-exposed virulence protein
VYKLGVRFVDAAGNTTDSECAIIVDHDQRGVLAEDSGESYRVTLDGTGGTPECDGNPPDEDAGTPGDGDGDDDVPPGDGDGDDVPPGDGDGDDDVPPGDGDGDDDVPPGDGDGDEDVPPGDGDGDDDSLPPPD